MQAVLRPKLKAWGFRSRGRAFNRTTDDRLTQVIQFQMGGFDPPGTPCIPGYRENLYGKFTVNVGVYVPEVAKYRGSSDVGSFIQEFRCCVRARLGELGPERADLWWNLDPNSLLISTEIERRLEGDALPFLARFGSRDAILEELLTETKNGYASTPRIVCAIILAQRGLNDQARRLLAAQAGETGNPGHSAFVRGVAEKLGLGELDA